MRKILDLKELTTDNLLLIAEEHDYQLCLEEIDEYVAIQDEEDLSQLLSDLGVVFLDNDDEYYYYQLNNVKFKVPYELTDEDEYGCSDEYLFFDILERI